MCTQSIGISWKSISRRKRTEQKSVEKMSNLFFPDWEGLRKFIPSISKRKTIKNNFPIWKFKTLKSFKRQFWYKFEKKNLQFFLMEEMHQDKKMCFCEISKLNFKLGNSQKSWKMFKLYFKFCFVPLINFHIISLPKSIIYSLFQLVRTNIVRLIPCRGKISRKTEVGKQTWSLKQNSRRSSKIFWRKI